MSKKTLEQVNEDTLLQIQRNTEKFENTLDEGTKDTNDSTWKENKLAVAFTNHDIYS